MGTLPTRPQLQTLIYDDDKQKYPFLGNFNRNNFGFDMMDRFKKIKSPDEQKEFLPYKTQVIIDEQGLPDEAQNFIIKNMVKRMEKQAVSNNNYETMETVFCFLRSVGAEIMLVRDKLDKGQLAEASFCLGVTHAKIQFAIDDLDKKMEEIKNASQ